MADTSVSYKCPKCGAPLSFLPGHDKVTCEFCGSEYPVAEIEKLFAQKETQAAAAATAEEQSWDTSKAGSQWDQGEAAQFQTLVCSSCGAELVADGNTMMNRRYKATIICTLFIFLLTAGCSQAQKKTDAPLATAPKAEAETFLTAQAGPVTIKGKPLAGYSFTDYSPESICGM